jgi:hypothetical protein
MSFPRFAFLGVLSLTAGVGAACGGQVNNQAGSASTGSGGTTTTTTATMTTTTTTVVDAGPDVDNGMPSDMYPAPHPPPPQVHYLSGPVLQSPKFVPVFFAGDDPTYVMQLTDFDNKVGGSAYWTAAVGEYNVGPGTSTMPVMLTEMAPATIDDSAIQTWLTGKLNGNDPAWPVNDANTVYVLHYPAATTITLQGSASCQAFGGYHSNATLDATHGSADVAYAVIPRCTNFPPLTGIDAITGTESHELAEAATDPYPMTQPAYAQVDDGHFYWERVLGGGEVGDMCAQFRGVWVKPAGLPYTVQRIWSNQNALAGHDPCQPALPNEVYFNAAPVLPDTIIVSTFGMSTVVKGVKIPVGMSKTIDVDLFSDAATSGPWTVTANDTIAALGGGSPLLQLSLDRNTGVNGEKLHLTIQVLKAGKHNTESFLLKSQLNGTSQLNGAENVWIGIVGQ